MITYGLSLLNPPTFQFRMIEDEGLSFSEQLRRLWVGLNRPSRLVIPGTMVEAFMKAVGSDMDPCTSVVQFDTTGYVGTCYFDADIFRNEMGLGLVVYADDTITDHIAFSNGTDETSTCTFGEALAALKQGRRVARRGWNGKDMWLVLIRAGNAIFRSEAGDFDVQDCIGMRTAQGQMQPGWLASQADLLSDDWVIL